MDGGRPLTARAAVARDSTHRFSLQLLFAANLLVKADSGSLPRIPLQGVMIRSRPSQGKRAGTGKRPEPAASDPRQSRRRGYGASAFGIVTGPGQATGQSTPLTRRPAAGAPDLYAVGRASTVPSNHRNGATTDRDARARKPGHGCSQAPAETGMRAAAQGSAGEGLRPARPVSLRCGASARSSGRTNRSPKPRTGRDRRS